MFFLISSFINRNLKFIFSNIVLICVAGYFTYHMISGARGAVSWAMLSMELDAIERELNALKEENAFLENKINCLRENNLDLDLLEEQARNILGFANENDTIVLLPREIK